MIHRGYAYYSTYYPGCESCILGRVKLDANEEPEELYKVDGAGADIYRMKPYGDYLFFQAGNYAENNIDFNGGLKFYNIVTGEIDDISDDIITDYVVARDGSVYYEKESGVVYKYNDDGNEEFFDTKSGEDLIGLYVDKNTLLVECCAEEYIQYALDFDGNVLNVVVLMVFVFLLTDKKEERRMDGNFSYKEFISNIYSTSDTLSTISIFRNNTETIKKNKMIKKAYEAVRYTEVEDGDYEALDAMMNNKPIGILCIIFALVFVDLMIDTQNIKPLVLLI